MRDFHLTINGKRYAVRAGRDPDSNDLLITIDGRTHRVQVEEEETGASAGVRPPAAAATPRPPVRGGGGGKILAPLPGVVLSVEAAPGDAARAGDTLIVLEAMKMENVIAADSDCVVQAVHVRQGDKVEASQPLMDVS